jgi:hypothetical protein
MRSEGAQISIVVCNHNYDKVIESWLILSPSTYYESPPVLVIHGIYADMKLQVGLHALERKMLPVKTYVI